jgi:glycosyltransferase involved in cell wall biosynthesis
MIQGLKVVVIMPAYNAALTLRNTYQELPLEIVDEIILVDDCSHDDTVDIAHQLGLTIIKHDQNMGYGANQKTCYTCALEHGADIVVMVHPDYQYSPRLCGAMAWMIASDDYDLVLASRILGKGALAGGMPVWKYVSNRFLTAAENLLLNMKLSEYHTGYRAFARRVLETLPLLENSDDFVFDNQIIAQAVHFNFRIGEISCPARYMLGASSINFSRSCKYGLGVLMTALSYRLHKLGACKSAIFSQNGKRLVPGTSVNREQVFPSSPKGEYLRHL